MLAADLLCTDARRAEICEVVVASELLASGSVSSPDDHDASVDVPYEMDGRWSHYGEPSHEEVGPISQAGLNESCNGSSLSPHHSQDTDMYDCPPAPDAGQTLKELTYVVATAPESASGDLTPFSLLSNGITDKPEDRGD